jgi:hypothetical protein
VSGVAGDVTTTEGVGARHCEDGTEAEMVSEFMPFAECLLQLSLRFIA